jgi:D-apionolactonase
MTVMRDEIVRRVYVAVRDEAWNTIEPTITNVQAEQLYTPPLGAPVEAAGLARRGRPRGSRPEPPEDYRKGDFAGFRIEFDAEHRRGDIDFAWHGAVTARWALQGATARIELRYEMDGRARSTFRTSRTGVCVLHPTPSSEDVAPVALVKHTNGARTRSKLPYFISPDQPFTDIQSITHWPWPGTVVSATVDFEGDVFEMEDQRNWGDASYKTYSRPLSQPFPYTLKKGQKVRQAVAMEVVVRNYRAPRGHRRVLPRPERAAGVNVMSADVGRARGMGTVPAIGVARGPSEEPLRDGLREKLRGLNLSHLRVDLSEGEAASDTSPAALSAVADAKNLKVPLEVALHLRPVGKDARSTLAQRVAPILKDAGVARFIVYEIGRHVASDDAVAAVKKELASLYPKVPVGPGTLGNFTELNRNRPKDAAALLAWPLNPQMHGADDLTVMENLSAQCDTVCSARAFAPGAALAVGPVTLHRRADPFAAGKAPGGAVVAPDPRQRTDFGAAWTLGSIKYLAEAGANSATYFQAGGPFGLTDAAELFPLYHVLADVGEFAGGEVLAAETTEPRWMAALTLRKDDRLRVLVANFYWEPQPVRLARIPGYVPVVGSKALLENVLPPYGVARFDFFSEDGE